MTTKSLMTEKDMRSAIRGFCAYHDIVFESFEMGMNNFRSAIGVPDCYYCTLQKMGFIELKMINTRKSKANTTTRQHSWMVNVGRRVPKTCFWMVGIKKTQNVFILRSNAPLYDGNRLQPATDCLGGEMDIFDALRVIFEFQQDKLTKANRNLLSLKHFN